MFKTYCTLYFIILPSRKIIHSLNNLLKLDETFDSAIPLLPLQIIYNGSKWCTHLTKSIMQNNFTIEFKMKLKITNCTQ